MYILNKPIALTGIAVAALSTVLCPFLKAPFVGNWNLYQTDYSLFFITIGLLSVSVLVFFLRKVGLFLGISRLFLGWCILGCAAVYFKINHYFGFKLADGLLGKTLHLKWGWFVLFLGAIIMLFSVRKVKEIH